jgi:N-acyl-D-aspartate/D-glutamate deacylase
MLDLIVRGGVVVDGTGAPAKRADVGVRGGRIVAVGEIDEATTRVIDADGLVVAPGFIDVHTHYDAQIMWDPAVTPSSLHGVTTVLGGNCGFTIAPIAAGDADYLLPMLARVEGMSVDALQAGLNLDWDSFGSWLDRLDGRVAVNAGFMCGHTTLRRVVMGKAAVGEQATPAQLEAMAGLLHRSLEEGALGLSSSYGTAHVDHNGDPVPSRFATREELLTLCDALNSHEGTWLEFIPVIDRLFSDETADLMADMSVAAGGRSLNWNALTVRPGDAEREARESRLRACDIASARGGKVVGLAMPTVLSQRLSLATGFLFETFPGFEAVRLPHDEKLRQLRDPEVRRRMKEGAASLGYRPYTDWPRFVVGDVGDPALKALVGRTFTDIGIERGIDAFDALLDVAIEDDFRTGLEPPLVGDDDWCWEERVRLLRDPRTIAGGSDAGAHLDMSKTFAASSQFLAQVRNRGLLGIEEAVRLFTSEPARFFGIRDRGCIGKGQFADIVVFDGDTIDTAPIEMRYDMPAGAMRLTSSAVGVAHVIVNGTEIVDHGQVTGATPGTVLRSGRDTKTVSPNTH